MTADEESILKRQARRRLIGAIALATAVVVTLPIVFDGEPPPATVSDIELRIPDKDKTTGFQSPASALAGVTVAASAAVPAPVSAPAPAPTTALVALPAVAATALIAAPVVAAAVAPHSPEPKVEAPKAEVVKPLQTEHKVESKPKAEAQAKVAPHVAVPHSGFVVQVGAFSNSDAAKKLQEKLAAQGLHAYAEKVGANVRVRVGGFSTHDAADKVRHKLEQQGLHPNVVSLGG